MLLLALLLAAAPVKLPYRQVPEPGIHRYVYQATETVVGGPVHGYRTEFDLEYSPDAVTAIIRSASVSDGNSSKPVELDTACRTAMHGDSTSLARVKLFPLPADAKTLGEPFLAMCAPAGVFFPLTDILNVILIPGEHFNAAGLRTVGQSLSFPGFDAEFDRAGIGIKETTAGGDVSLISVGRDRAVLDWKPASADLEIFEHGNNPPIRLKGRENFAFRTEIDRNTGAIIRAATIYDNLDMKIVGAPEGTPNLKIVRAASIEPR